MIHEPINQQITARPPQLETFVQLVQWRAAQQPDDRLYTFLLDGESDEVTLTYAELDRRARAIGALLQRSGAVGERALLLYQPGLNYIAALFGCFYAGTIAVPLYPPPAQVNRPATRLQAVLANARATIALTTTQMLSAIERRFDDTPELRALTWLTTDTLGEGVADLWREPALSADSLTLLQYTSGSTGAPKGVMLTHSNLLHNSALINRCIQLRDDGSQASCGVCWLPPYHDMGLIGGILQPLYRGMPMTLMSPVSFLQRPFRWLQAISRTGALFSGGPNFAYELCLRKVKPEQRATLDLSRWKMACNGAEPVRRQTLERFAEAFAPYGLRPEALTPGYGLAETTLLVSICPPGTRPTYLAVRRAPLEQGRIEVAPSEQPDTMTLVGCGINVPEQQVVIVEPQTCLPCLPLQVGEIWVKGRSVAQGYWEQPEETERSFHAYLADSGDGPFLRSGDLGFWKDGELFIAGRIKDVIIIRGANYYPQDIELTVERSHPALRFGGGAAFSVDIDGAERLVIVQEIERQYRNSDHDEVIGAIRQAIAEQHELQTYAVVLIKPGSIPKTSSGKIQRYACRAAFLNQTLETVGE